jgi:hypothetical protein
VTHTCNSTYSRGRAQEDHRLKPAWTNSSWDPILENTHHKSRAGGVAQGVGPEFKHQYYQKTKQKEKQAWQSGSSKQASKPSKCEALGGGNWRPVLRHLPP